MFTKILCGQCGGTFVSQDMPPIGFYECMDCGHMVTSGDLSLGDGETETTDVYGVLGYTTEAS